MKAFGRALLLAMLAVGLVAVPAQAAPDPAAVYNMVANSDDPEATANSLTKAQRAALEKYLKPAKITIEETSTVIAADGSNSLALVASTCREGGHAIGVRNIIGTLLWTWNMYAEWCGDGERVTYNYSRVYGRTYVAFWSWRTIDKHQSMNTIVSPDRLLVFGQGEFKLCVFADIGCVQYSYPVIEARLYGNLAQSWRSWT